jgi:hypothetical protein
MYITSPVSLKSNGKEICIICHSWVNRSSGVVFVAEAVDKIWPFAVVGEYITDFFMF